MLIGADWMKALEPLEIISSRNDGPYVYRTKLGWCTVGSIVNKSGNKSVKCNRIAVKDVISGKVFSHRFKIDSRLKKSEVGVKEMFERIFHNGFSEVKQLQLNIVENIDEISRKNIDEISREDKKFLKILETETKENGNNYEVPLPLKDTDVPLPNNKNQAVKRINQPKRRFQKDSKFFEDYKRNMEELLEKGYARKFER